jgi:AraC family transcriptional regulator of adaptative response / DNA-3-methyladenine glycosylase II
VLDPKLCYQALQARDERFDGRVFVGVTTTGIYCRPVCPAGPARFENCRFYPSAAAAQQAGYRPCLRCRPETAPELGSWRGTSNTVSRGLQLIAAGALNGDSASVDALAERLGVGARQLRRLFQRHLGASPLAVAQTQRVLFAQQLIVETRLPMSEIALAAGFGSVRRFNETFQRLFQRPPSSLRRTPSSACAGLVSLASDGVTVRLRYRAPYDWSAMLAYLRARAIDGLEHVDERRYRRTLVEQGQTGTLEVAHLPEQSSLSARIRFPDVRALPLIIARVRSVFDLGADVTSIGAHLARDPALAALIAERPGLRAPGAWDGFELGARAILGQQVSVEAGRRLAGQLVQACGARVSAIESGDVALSSTFPDAARVAESDLGALRMPNARRQALAALARAVLADPALFHPLGTVEETVARLRAIPGIGEWTAQYIAIRAVREPDAFPAGDVALQRGACASDGTRPSSRELLRRAESWRPWRAYAAQHLWAAAAIGTPVSRKASA